MESLSHHTIRIIRTITTIMMMITTIAIITSIIISIIHPQP